MSKDERWNLWILNQTICVVQNKGHVLLKKTLPKAIISRNYYAWRISSAGAFYNTFFPSLFGAHFTKSVSYLVHIPKKCYKKFSLCFG